MRTARMQAWLRNSANLTVCHFRLNQEIKHKYGTLDSRSRKNGDSFLKSSEIKIKSLKPIQLLSIRIFKTS